MKLNFIEDKVINLESNDLLGAIPYIETLQLIITSSDTPFTIGLFGGWGIGKSSIVKTIEDVFNNDKKSGVIVFKYDAWKYSKDTFRRTFLLNFLKYFHLDTKEVKSYFYSSRTQNTSWGFSKFLSYNKSKSVTTNKIIEPEIFEGIFQEAIFQIIPTKVSLWKYFKEFIGYEKKISKVVIVIDNIDRCHKDLAFELLLTIKNFLEQKNVIFVIPIDETEIKNHIKDQGHDPNEFLRKLFNTTISIKKISEGDLFDFAKKLNDKYKLNFPIEVISIVSQEFSKNPRKIIQFLNVLQTELLLANNQEKNETIPKGSITDNLPFLTKILIIREEWSNIYSELKETPYFLNNFYDEIEDKTFNNIKLTDDQLNFFRRTEHIKPNHTNFELFFINKDYYKDIPDNVNKLVESSDIENIKKLIKEEAISLGKLIEFIDSKFETALKRGEIKTSIVNILSLFFQLSIDGSLKKEMKEYLYGESKFLGGIKNFMNSTQIYNILLYINENTLLQFIKENKSITKKLKSSVISVINKEKNIKKLLIGFLYTFKDTPQEFKNISQRFTSLIKEDFSFIDEIKEILESPEIIENLIDSSLIDEFIEQVENKTDSAENDSKMEIILLYHSKKGLSELLLEKYVTKIISFINSINDYVSTPFWLLKLKPLLRSVKNDSLITNIFNSLNSKQQWFGNSYNSAWNNSDYQESLYILLDNAKELYFAPSKSPQETQIVTWFNNFFSKNESQELIIYVNNLYKEIISHYKVYDWPFSQNIVDKFNQIQDWNTKKEIASTLNMMLSKTRKDEGLSESQIHTIYRNYINIIDDENKKEIVEWLSTTLKNKDLTEPFETIINELSISDKLEIIEILKQLGKDQLIETIIKETFDQTDCDELDDIFEKLEEAEIKKDIIKKSIKNILSEIDDDDDNFNCFIEFIATNPIADQVIHNKIAEKIKHLLVSTNKENLLFALKIIDLIKMSDRRKIRALKTLIQDIDKDLFEEEELKLLEKVKKKMK